MWERFSEEILSNHRGKLIGSLLGLVIALAIIRLGFLWTVFAGILTFLGYSIGRRVDEQKENVLDIIDRYLPPGDR
jgi:uncharacterized membrane protein